MGAARVYFGSNDYISELTGLSARSVRRALGELKRAGLIYEEEAFGRSGLRAALSPRVGEAVADEGGRFVRENGTLCPKKVDSLSAAIISDNKEDNKEIATTPSPVYRYLRSADDLTRKGDGGGNPPEVDCRATRIYVSSWGREGIVTMTHEQYDELLSLVGEETLDIYIERLEGLLLSVKGEVYPHSHYRTLRGWLMKDFSV